MVDELSDQTTFTTLTLLLVALQHAKNPSIGAKATSGYRFQTLFKGMRHQRGNHNMPVIKLVAECSKRNVAFLASI